MDTSLVGGIDFSVRSQAHISVSSSKRAYWSKGWQIFSVKDEIIDIFGFVGFMV